MTAFRIALSASLILLLLPSAASNAQSLPDQRSPSVASSPLEREALSDELRKLWTRDPVSLVGTIADAHDAAKSEVSLSFLLAIAFAETSGKVLIVSEAGATGLAQATPIAYLREGFGGKLFVTRDYVDAARAYIMKKPLGDASGIAERLADHCDSAHIVKARELIAAAFALRREGVSELLVLAPFSESLLGSIEADDARNLSALLELDGLLVNPDQTSLREFSHRQETLYQELKTFQRVSWRRYQDELAQRRDTILETVYGKDFATVKRLKAYEAGELLGKALDARFSPTEMARFLVAHVGTKRREARKLNPTTQQLDTVTAALYNGGSPNVLRMKAGLIRSLRETEVYMRKVPATTHRLDARRRTVPAEGAVTAAATGGS